MSASENMTRLRDESNATQNLIRQRVGFRQEVGNTLTNLFASETAPRAPGILQTPGAGRESFDISRRLSDIAFFHAKQKLEKETNNLYHQIEHKASQTQQTPEAVRGILLETVTAEHEEALRILELNNVSSKYSEATLALQSEYAILNGKNKTEYENRVLAHEAKRQRISSTINTMATLIELI